MGIVENVGRDAFPKQGSYLGKQVEVCFGYDFDNAIHGTIVRDDDEKPFVTIIQLDDGRVVLSTECQYTLA